MGMRRRGRGVRYEAGGRDLGVCAVEHAGEDLAGDYGRFPLRGRATREEGDGPGAWGRAGSGKGETRRWRAGE